MSTFLDWFYGVSLFSGTLDLQVMYSFINQLINMEYQKYYLNLQKQNE